MSVLEYVNRVARILWDRMAIPLTECPFGVWTKARKFTDGDNVVWGKIWFYPDGGLTWAIFVETDDGLLVCDSCEDCPNLEGLGRSTALPGFKTTSRAARRWRGLF